MIMVKKIDLLGNKEFEQLVYCSNDLENTLVACLESNVNHNNNTWTYGSSKFKEKLKFNKYGNVAYCMINESVGYSAKLI